VRLNATFRSLGILFGPVVGSALLLGFGPTAGIFTNIAIYLPLTLFLFRTSFTGHSRHGAVARPRIGVVESLRVLREVRADHTLVSMIALAGLGSFFVGASLQSTMPIFAQDLGAGDGGAAYGVLLFATGVGGVVGGVLLEATSRIRPTLRTALLSTGIYGAASLLFAGTGSYPVAVALLFVVGVANLASMSIAQTIVQLRAPSSQRGRVVGLFGVSANGLRAGSGFTVGLAGAALGVHWSLGLSAALLCLGAVVAAWYALGTRSAHAGG
jgi:hypothetical protein